ncbi:MAG: hypothetical protein RLZZ298_531 [Pseudomonadota bacterium]|jgi:acyl-[acyl carrier protein]--UDP-N-acetylglucosamine O-acyltransferase
MSSIIHSTSFVEQGAIIGDGVEIGPFSVVHKNVILHDGCKVGGYCELGIETPLSNGSPLVIGANSIIRSHSIFYEASVFGERLVTGHRVTVRENAIAGKNLQIGTLGDIQGDCKIGDYVRFHSNVHIGKMSAIGNFVWVFPYVVLTNDPTPPSDILLGVTLEDYSIVATMSVILPGVRVGSHALVAAHACVGKDVPPSAIVGGTPAKILGNTSGIKRKDLPTESAYPWPKHFHRGYPESVVEQWKREFVNSSN